MYPQKSAADVEIMDRATEPPPPVEMDEGEPVKEEARAPSAQLPAESTEPSWGFWRISAHRR